MVPGNTAETVKSALINKDGCLIRSVDSATLEQEDITVLTSLARATEMSNIPEFTSITHGRLEMSASATSENS